MIYPKHMAAALTVALMAAVNCTAQTPAELLQKGIYTQETAGDSDAALQIYRQTTAAAPPQSPVGAQAQFRIAELLLQKGDLNGAATEFSVLATRYPEHHDLIAKMAGRLRGNQEQATGAVRDGRFRDSRTGLEFGVPAGWKVTYNGPSSDNGQMVGLSNGSSVDFGAWMIPKVSTPAEITQRLQKSPAAKARMNANIPGFAFRPESIQSRTIGGLQAASATADYVDNGKKMAAYYVWVFTTKTHVMFVARDVPVEDLAINQSYLDQLVASSVIP